MDSINEPLIERPSAWLPIAMSLTALVIVAGHLAFDGATREPDEGIAAHFWQLLMAGQLPVIVWHAVRWLRRSPGQGTVTIAVQTAAFLAALAPVWYFNL